MSQAHPFHRERRRYRRARPGLRAAVGFQDEWELVPATVEDISLGGACLATPLHASSGSSLLLIMTLDDRTVPALATVVDTAHKSAEEERLHVSFAWISDDSRRRLATVTSRAAC